MTDFWRQAQALRGELDELRHELHRWPEMGNREFRTASRIETCLHACGIETERVTETAVVGRLRGMREGPSVALRADMDALPILEETGAAYASQNGGVMHACGHDVHIASVLGAAKLLSEHRRELPGTVVFLFQPDEEGQGGAQRMIDAGALEGVDAVFGGHVSPELPAGHLGIRYGKFYAASDMFRVIMHGRSAHGAEREKGADALGAAAAAVSAVLALPEAFPAGESVATVGTFHAGTAGNILAGQAEFSGILRTLGAENRVRMRDRFCAAVRAAAAEFGAVAQIDLTESYPGVVNHDGTTRLAEDTFRALFGETCVHRLPRPTLTTEDFGFYLQKCPGTFYHIGAGCGRPLHSASFLPDDDAVVTAAAAHAAVVLAALQDAARDRECQS